MSPTIQGSAAFSGFQMREETSTWGTGVGSWYDVPIIRETFRTEHDFAPPSPEFGDVGAETIVTHVGKRIVGEVAVNLRLDAAWTHILLAHVLGTEDLRNESHIDGTDATVATDVSTHWYINSGQGRSLQFRSWKSGPDDTGYRSLLTGCVTQSARIEWVADGLLTLTFSYIGKLESLETVSGQVLGAPAGSITTDPRWLSNTGAALQTGATLADLNLRSFVVNVNRQVTQVPSFANDIDSANQPGPTSNREVTLEIASLLEQDFAAAGKPALEHINRTVTKALIKLRDTTTTADGGVYAMNIDFPSGVWRAADTALKEAGTVPTSFTFQAKKGTFTTFASGTNHADSDYRVGIEVKESDEPPTTPNHFTDAGGAITQLTDGA